MKPGIVPDVGQPPWADDALEHPSHIDVEKRCGFSLLEQEDRVRHVQANRRDGHVLCGIQREDAAIVPRITCEAEERGRPAAPKAERPEDLLEISVSRRRQACPVWIASEESIVKTGNSGRGSSLQ